MQNSERRQADRFDDYRGCRISMNGRLVTLVDVSETGARVQSLNPPPLGETVVMDLPWGKRCRAGIIGVEGNQVRLQFHFRIEMPT